jgi:Xaa-Pro aminopeptidase
MNDAHDVTTEIATKIARVRAYLKQQKLDGVVLGTRANWAWLSGGGDGHIVSQCDDAFGALAITPRGAYLLANNIEMVRFVKEEPVAAFTPKVFPWITPMSTAVANLIGKKDPAAWASDTPGMTGLRPLPGDFGTECRAQLVEAEIRRYKALGRDCAVAAETVARSLHPGDSEHQAEADLARHLLSRGIQPFVLLVAFDERITSYRHPAPTGKRLKHHAMLVVCGQRHGLIASLTRFIHFGALPKDLAKRHEAVCRVEAAYWEATVPGASYGSAFAAGQKQYKAEGFAKEWELHHQGGPTGYAGRDYVVTPGESRLVLPNQAVAWNPSITGAKTEDTFVIEGSAKVGWVQSVVTACTEEWPTITVKSPAGNPFVRPAVLVR